MPPQSLILQQVNSTYIIVALDSWQTGGCPITSFDVEYQVMGGSIWHAIQSGINPNTVV